MAPALGVTHLGPGVLLAEQVGVEVGHLPLALVGEAPHQLPVAHVVELLPVLLGLTALLEPPDSLRAPAAQRPPPRGLCGPALLWASLVHTRRASPGPGDWPAVLTRPPKSYMTLGLAAAPLRGAGLSVTT